ncbi:harmonin-binding protein USHBP1 isoform X2 [Erythrolamprus reginae]|uniref:harmonin-binding protein USHBP1 isoform X2 n=1 Tax=Erythrolamprus reginae TaxID=121349 RepID=UPI00396CF27E
MEEWDLGPPGQEESGEESSLHYEELITRLLVTIVRLQEKMERLEQDRARQEEEEEEGDFFSDLGSESTASLPRCPTLSARRARSPSPPPPAALEEEKADLFLDVHKALTSLETLLLSYRSRLPSVEAELQGCAQLAQGLEARLGALQQREGSGCSPPREVEDPPCEEMTALYKERNAALRAELEAQEELLGHCRASLAAHQRQRDKLQRKVQELQGSLSRLEESCSEGAWGAPSFQPAPTPPASPPAEIQSSLEQLHRRLEGLWGLNQLLSGALQQSKTDAEQLSLLLGRQESHQTGLDLALHGSERCLEAYETLWALTAAEQKPSPETGAEAPWAGPPRDPSPALDKADWILQACSRADQSSWDSEEIPDSLSRPLTGSVAEAKRRLWHLIVHLRAQQTSLRLPTPQPPPPELGDVAARLSAGIGAKVAEGQRAVQEALPGSATLPRMEKGQLLRELHKAREALAELGTRLHLTTKAKQGLALWTHTLPAQEAACLLVIRALQGEQRDLRGQPDPPSESSGSSSEEEEEESQAWVPADGRPPRRPLPAAPKDAERGLAHREPEALRLRVLETSARIRALKDRLQGLWVELEEKSQDYRAHEAQEMELMQDFFQAHRQVSIQ